MAREREFVIGQIKRFVRLALLLVRGILSAPSKEVAIGLLQIVKGSLHHALGHVIGPRIRCLPNRIELFFERKRVGRLEGALRFWNRFPLQLVGLILHFEVGSAPVIDESLVPQARLRYSTCSGVGFIRILCAVFMLECLLSCFAALTNPYTERLIPLTDPLRLQGDGDLGWLFRSLPKAHVRVASPPDVGTMGPPPSSELEQVYQRKRERSREVWSRNIDVPRPHPKKERRGHPLLETPGLSSPIPGTVWDVSRTFAHFVKI